MAVPLPDLVTGNSAGGSAATPGTVTRAPGPDGLPERRTDPGARAFDGAGRLARALLSHAPGRSALAAVLLLIAAVTEVFGIALLIPLLYAAGIEGAANGEASRVRDAIAAGADGLGVELTLPVLLGGFVLLAGLRSGAAWQRDLQTAALQFGFVDRLRERLYRATAAAAWPYLVRRRSSELLHVLVHDATRAGQGAMQLIYMSVGVTFAVAQGALAVAISPPGAFAILLMGGVLLVVAAPLWRRSRTLGNRLSTGGRTMHAAMAEFLGGLKLAKSEAAEARHVRDFTGALADMRRQQLDFTRANSAARAIFNVGAAAAVAVVLGLGVAWAGLNVPELLVLVIIAGRLLPALLRLQQGAQQLAHDLPAWLHVLEMEEALRDAAETRPGPEAPPLPLRRELTVRGVRFNYHGPASPHPPALAGLDFTVAAHRMVAVTGPSGVGKTTLVDMLLGLIEPDAGEIRVDGVRLSGAARQHWRRGVAYVPQDAHLFHETLRTNLLRGRPDATEAELWRALRQASADTFVAALPDGLETVAGDRGGRLSGGERQRIVLARALLREPALLLLDEATGQLDADAERRVLATLRSLRFRTTVVAVTHRESVLEAADDVVRLEAGRVADTGAPGAPANRPAAEPARAAAGQAAANPPWLPGLLSVLLLAAGAPGLADARTGEDPGGGGPVSRGPEAERWHERTC